VGYTLAESFRNEPWLGFDVTGVYDDQQPESPHGDYAGSFADLVEQARAGQIDNIYIAMAMSEEAQIKTLVRELTDTTCSVMLIPDVFTFNILNSRTEEVNGVPVVPLFATPLNGINRILKRLEDIVLSAMILLFISPVLLCISAGCTAPGGSQRLPAGGRGKTRQLPESFGG